MKKIMLAMLVIWSTSTFAEDVYDCHAGQNTFLKGGSIAGILMQVGKVKVPADGKIYEFKADKLDKGFVYIYITHYSDSKNVVARSAFVPFEKRFTTFPDPNSLTPFFGFEVIEATNPISNGSNLRASHDELLTIPGNRTKDGLPLDVTKASYLNCYLSKS